MRRQLKIPSAKLVFRQSCALQSKEREKGMTLPKKISIVSSCYNEEENLPEWHARIKETLKKLSGYNYEIIIADNCSQDGSRQILREMAEKDKRFKVIFNANNFGHIRSPHNAMLQATGDAIVYLCSDLQDPPEFIANMVHEWEKGAKVVCAVKPTSKENFIMASIRRLYYILLSNLSETPQIRNFTGFGLYDRQAMDAIKLYRDPYPYARGIIGEIGFKRVEIPYVQDKRKHGVTKNNLFTLYDMAMTGFVNHTKLPLRLAVFTGFVLAFLSLLISAAYLAYKILYWNTFSLGLAPLVIGLFFFSGIQLVFIGVLGEYLGARLDSGQKQAACH